MKHFFCLAVVGLACFCSISWVSAEKPTPGADAPGSPDSTFDLLYLGENRPILFRLHVTVEGRPLSALWDDHVTRVFKYLDVNRDGVLDRGEVQRMPSADALFGGRFRAGSPMRNQLDVNGDGKVTRAELTGYLRRIGPCRSRCQAVEGLTGKAIFTGLLSFKRSSRRNLSSPVSGAGVRLIRTRSTMPCSSCWTPTATVSCRRRN